MELKPGMKKTMIYKVDDRSTAISMSSGALEVYATPMLIAAMEETCMLLAAEALKGSGNTTVGTLVNIRHLAPSPVGAEVTVDCELIEVDDRRLAFNVSARDSEELVGEGIHERFVVDTGRFMQKVNDKKIRAARIVK